MEAIGFNSKYQSQIRANNSLSKSLNVGPAKRQENSNKGRMFGIDTGNSDTDQEAGMWLFALLGTLAAAVPVAFLSPNLGFKKRSVNNNLFWDAFDYQFNNSIKINSTVKRNSNVFRY